MRLLASTDIALRVLILLGQETPGRLVNVDALAARLGGLSSHHLHKIIQDLTALGLTRTVRGAGGGAALAKVPEEIRLGRVIRALEGGQALVDCFRDGACTCTLLPDCRLQRMLGAAQSWFYESLDDRTLADCLPVAAAAPG